MKQETHGSQVIQSVTGSITIYKQIIFVYILLYMASNLTKSWQEIRCILLFIHNLCIFLLKEIPKLSQMISKTLKPITYMYVKIWPLLDQWF